MRRLYADLKGRSSTETHAPNVITLTLLLLFIIFFAADAGRVWGLDGRRG